MPTGPQPLYPIFIKWMPFHIPILFLMYAFIVMKLLKYFKVIQISFELQNQRSTWLNIIFLIICYHFIIACIIYMYKKVLLLKIKTLEHTGAANLDEYEKHKKINTQNELHELQRNGKFIQWKKQQLQKEQNQKLMLKVVYEVIQSSSQDEVQRMSEHRLAIRKRIF